MYKTYFRVFWINFVGSNRGFVKNVFLQVQKGRLKRTTGSWTALRDASAGVLVIYRVVKQIYCQTHKQFLLFISCLR